LLHARSLRLVPQHASSNWNFGVSNPEFGLGRLRHEHENRVGYTYTHAHAYTHSDFFVWLSRGAGRGDYLDADEQQVPCSNRGESLHRRMGKRLQ
jgi:hypothetical protein